MRLPQIVIVGRPNVGKSSIFNWLAGKRLAIVDSVAGITRDRMTRIIEHGERHFELVDTGGIGINDVDRLDREIDQQISIAIEQADVLLLVTTALDGITPLDQQVAQRLRGASDKVLLVVNKTDSHRQEPEIAEFRVLGFGAPLATSVAQNRGRETLLDGIAARLPPIDVATPPVDPEMKIAVVGRRNVGKSTFINTLTHSPRMIVSEVAGTTRDSVDVRFEMDGKTFVAIDTPGLRRGKSVRSDIDYYGVHRAHRSIRYADVVLMFFDASQRISNVDRQLCGYIAELFKPCILVVNKWDLLAEHLPTEEWTNYLRDNFPSLWNVPIAFVTSTTGRNIKKLLNHAQMLFKQSRQRVATPDLNRIINRAVQHQPPPLSGRRRPKIYYAAQIATAPPTIVLKCNDPRSFPPTYQRYLLGVLMDTLPFGEVPLRLILEKRTSAAKPARSAGAARSGEADRAAD